MNQALELESSTVEWKESLPEVTKILKTVIGFANQFGGKILFGITNSGEIAGLNAEQAHKILEILSQAIYNECFPPIMSHIYPQVVNNKTIVVVEVSEGMSKPYHLKSLGAQKGTFVRVGRSTVLANAETLQELTWRARGKYFDHLPLYQFAAKKLEDSFSLTELKKLGIACTPAMLEKHKLIAQENKLLYPTISGNLLFGSLPQNALPEAVVYCSHFKGTSGREAISHLKCEGTLFEQFHKAYDFIFENIPKSFKILSKKRKETLAVPELALREALVNLLVHRDYSQSSPSKIAIFANRVEFFSPGIFPGPFSQSNLHAGITYIRNPTITHFFHKAGLMERLGTGFTTIFSEYRKITNIVPVVTEGDGFVKCILPFITETQEEKLKTLSTEELKIMRFVNAHEKISASEVDKLLKVSRSTSTRLLQKLLKSGDLKTEGKGPTRVYVLV